MVETIYHAEIQEEDKIKLPKNICQVGSGETKYHIYLEEKVAEFVRLLPENEKNIRYGVFVGEVKYSKGCVYAFARGAVEVRDVLENTLLFGDEVWTGIYDDIKRYYQGEKVIGWYASLPEFHERDLFQIRKLHLDYFAGNDKIFLNVNREEEELEFYTYRQTELAKVLCYHIYHEKNQEMEHYVLETHYDLMTKRKNAKVKAESIHSAGVKNRGISEKNEKMENKIIEDKPVKSGAGEKRESSRKQEAAAQKDSDKTMQTGLFGKLAYAAVFGTLLFTIGSMYQKGQFQNLTEEMKEAVAGITDQKNTMDGQNVVLTEDWYETTAEGEAETAAEAAALVMETGEQAEQNQTGAETTAQAELPESLPAETTMQETAAQEVVTETAIQATEAATEIATEAATATTKKYLVEDGDTLYSICKRMYGDTSRMEEIIRLNGLADGDSIISGKILIIP